MGAVVILIAFGSANTNFSFACAPAGPEDTKAIAIPSDVMVVREIQLRNRVDLFMSHLPHVLQNIGTFLEQIFLRGSTPKFADRWPAFY